MRCWLTTSFAFFKVQNLMIILRLIWWVVHHRYQSHIDRISRWLIIFLDGWNLNYDFWFDLFIIFLPLNCRFSYFNERILNLKIILSRNLKIRDVAILSAPFLCTRCLNLSFRFIINFVANNHKRKRHRIFWPQFI